MKSTTKQKNLTSKADSIKNHLGKKNQLAASEKTPGAKQYQASQSSATNSKYQSKTNPNPPQ